MNNLYSRILFLFLSTSSLVAQQVPNLGSPEITNYNYDDYNSMSKNWAVSQGGNGFIYVANSDGLLEYDGQNWKKHTAPIPNNEVFSVNAVGHKVYVGMADDFGYWKYNSANEFEYTSLFPTEDEADHRYENFWKIWEKNGLIYFQSPENIYILKDLILTRISAPFKFNGTFKVDEIIYIVDNKYGLYKLSSNRLIKIDVGHIFINNSVASIIKGETEDEIIIATKTSGLYKLKDNSLTKWEITPSEFLKKNMIFSLETTKEGNLLFGTVLSGLLITDKHGNPLQHIDKSSGLQNNTVLGIFYDRNGDIWLALNDGIDYVKLNSPIAEFHDYFGKLGTVYTSSLSGKNLFLGTNQGLFVQSLDSLTNPLGSKKFDLIPNSVGQVWRLKNIRQFLICGHDKGTFLVNENEFKHISTIKGGWDYLEIPNRKDLFLGGNYDGLEIFKIVGNEIIALGQVIGFDESSRYMEFDEFGNLWISHTSKGAYRLRFNDTYSKIIENEFFALKDFTTNGDKIILTKLKDKVYFSDGFQLYEYNVVKGVIEPSSTLENEIKIMGSVERVFNFQNYLIVSNRGEINFFKKTDNDNVEIGSVFYNLTKSMGDDFENVNQLAKNQFLIGRIGGFTIYNVDFNVEEYSFNNEAPAVRTIRSLSNKGVLTNMNPVSSFQIPFEHRSLHFEFSYPSFNKFQEYYYTLSADGEIIAESKNKTGIFNLNYIGYKDYQLEVFVKLGENISSAPTIISINVDRPYYLLNRYLFAYFIIIILMALMLRYIYVYKVRLHNEQLRRDQKQQFKKQEEEYTQNKLIQQQQITELEKKSLESKVIEKSREIATMAQNRSERNELLELIKKKVIDTHESSSVRIPKKYENDILKFIDTFSKETHMRTAFEENFSEANADFFKRLLSKYPDLSPSDLKLAAYLKMNMSTKEIASNLNITSKSLEVARYRLRKKLGLSRKDVLVSFLLEI